MGFMASLERYAEAQTTMAGGRDVDGDRESHRADRRGFDRRECAADRRVPGAGHPQRAHDRSDSVGARRGARSGCRQTADALRGDEAHGAQRRGRPPRDREGSGGAQLLGGGAARAAGGDYRSQLPHLRRRRDHHRLQQRALRSRDRHPGDLRAARRGRSGARLLSRQGTGESEPRGDAGQDLSSGRCAGLGLSHAAGRERCASTCRSRSGRSGRAADPASGDDRAGD